MDELGFVRITDRTKDLIKSGGEWISSVDLENALMAHPAIAEAAVIAIPDPKWSERPLACIVWKKGAALAPAEIAGVLGQQPARQLVGERPVDADGEDAAHAGANWASAASASANAFGVPT